MMDKWRAGYAERCQSGSCRKYCRDRLREQVLARQYSPYNMYDRDPDTYKHYRSDWRKVRIAYLSTRPLCEECMKEGRYVPAEHVHHIVEVRDGGGNDYENLCSLCKSCHSSIHMRRRNG